MSGLQYRTAGHMALSLGSLAVLLGACYWTLRLAWAGQTASQGGVQGLAAATRLAPGDAALWTRYAEVAGPDEATRALQQAVALNPGDSLTWIQLGLAAEAGQDFGRAEHFYREAARASRQFQPAWTLANYFFRRGDRTEFRVWVTRALHMAYGDATPVFQLCWRASPDPGMVLGAVRDRRDLSRQYLAFLIAEGRLEAAGQAARQLLPELQPDDVPNLVAYCGRLLETGEAASAVEIWNELCRRRAIPYRALQPERGASLTNGGFDVPPSSLGFDWRIVPWPGVDIAHIPKPAGLRITFSGEQPESCETLTQLLPVLPGRTYHLRYEYRTPEAKPESGLLWKVFDTANGAELAGASAPLFSEDWQQRELDFSTGPRSRLVRLALIYQRKPGTTRMEGSLWLRQITLD